MTSGVTLFTSGVTLMTSSVTLFTSAVTLMTSGVTLMTSGVTLMTSCVTLMTSGVTHMTYARELDKYEDIKESNWKVIKKIKIELVKRLFNDPDVRKLVTWKLGDLININNDHALINYKNMKIMRTLKTNFGNKSHIDARKNQSSFADNVGRAFKLQSKI